MTEVQAGGLWCSEVLEGLDRYVDGTLSERELAAVQAHVAVCGQCASFGASYARVVSALRGHVADEPMGEDRLERLVRAVQREF